MAGKAVSKIKTHTPEETQDNQADSGFNIVVIGASWQAGTLQNYESFWKPPLHAVFDGFEVELNFPAIGRTNHTQ
jgi:hypothetical protein